MTHSVKNIMTNKVRNILMLLVFFMGMSNVAWGQDDTVWDGTTITKPLKLDPDQTKPSSRENPFQITTAAELAWFGQSNNSQTNWFQLAADIDLDNKDWSAFCTNKDFKGHFIGKQKADGTYYTIRNVKFDVPNIGSRNNGFLSKVTSGSIENINIDGVTIVFPSTFNQGTVRAAALVGCASGTTQVLNCNVSNVTFDYTTNSCTIAGASHVAGAIAGYADGTTLIKNCKATTVTYNYHAQVTVDNNRAGGLLGDASGTAEISGCHAKSVTFNYVGTTKSNAAIGGLVGYIGGNVTINNSHTDGYKFTSTGTITSGGFGGLVGNTVGKELKIINCSSKGADVQVDGPFSGGSISAFIGFVCGASTTSRAQVTGCTVSNSEITVDGTLGAKSYIGSLIAQPKQVDIKGCKWIGTSAKPSTITINSNITAGAVNVGGMIGYTNTACSVKNCSSDYTSITFNGNITAGEVEFGGLIGYMGTYTTVSNCKTKHGTIASSGNHTFANSLVIAVGGLVGSQATQAEADKDIFLKDCAVDCNIDFSTLKPVSTSNLVKNKFSIGGVMGRIYVPFRYPENLLYSGKIYAPFAFVGPVVGTIYKGDDDANFTDSYTGYNVEKIDAVERSKSSSWYYNGYKLGLSDAAKTRAAVAVDGVKRGNYDTSTTLENDRFLPVTNETFSRFNYDKDFCKDSKTVLWYTYHNVVNTSTKTEQGIQKLTATSDFPEYHMYYAQGVNMGQCVPDAVATALCDGIDKNIEESEKETPSLLTITDNKADVRGFAAHTLTASESVTWYVDGVEKSSGTSIEVSPAFDKGIAVLAIASDGRMTSTVVKLGVFDTKDHTSTNKGSKDNPYILTTEQDIRLLSKLCILHGTIRWEGTASNQYTHYTKAYYELGNDITMSDADFHPIGAPNFTGDGATNTYNQVYLFQGHFDGKCHSIKNLHITWQGGDYNAAGCRPFGLFGAVGNPTQQTLVGDPATTKTVIQNLIIDGAVLKHNTANTSFYLNNGTSGNSNYVMVGALAGIVCNNTTIQNIEVRNSKITDEGSSEYKLATRMLSVGGVVGRVQQAFNQVNKDLASSITLRFLSSDCDVDIQHAEFTATGTNSQVRLFNVGGIVGSMQSSGVATTMPWPQYTYYTGDVKARNAFVSPTFGSVDYSGNTSNNFSDYCKHYMATTVAGIVQDGMVGNYFGDYQIYPYASSAYSAATKITDLVPVNTCSYGARTITDYSSHKNATMYSDGYLGEFQGVNYGEYINTAEDNKKSEIEQIFGEALQGATNNSEIMPFAFFFDNEGRMHLQKNEKLVLSFNDANAATPAYATHTLVVGNTLGHDGFTYQWYNNEELIATTTDTDSKDFPLGITPQFIYVKVYDSNNELKYTSPVIDLQRAGSLTASYDKTENGDKVNYTVTPAKAYTTEGYTYGYEWKEWDGATTITYYTANEAFEENKSHIASVTKDGEAVVSTSWTSDIYANPSSYVVTYNKVKYTISAEAYDQLSGGEKDGYVLTAEGNYKKTISAAEYESLTAEQKTGYVKDGDNYTKTITEAEYNAIEIGGEKAEYTKDSDGTYYKMIDYAPITTTTPKSSSIAGKVAVKSPTTAIGNVLSDGTKTKTYYCIITGTDTKFTTFIANYVTDGKATYDTYKDLVEKYSTTLTAEIALKVETKKVIYLNPTGDKGGDDSNNGTSSTTPVKTWGKAYSLLDGSEGTTWDDNIIVLMGRSPGEYTWGTANNGSTRCYRPTEISHYGLCNTLNPGGDVVTSEFNTPKYEEYIAKIAASPMGKNVTITGNHNGIEYNAVIESPLLNESAKRFINLFGNTKFENLTFKGGGSQYDCVMCHYHDLWMGEGLIMKNYMVDEIEYGTMKGVATPRFQIFGGMHMDTRFNTYYDAKDGVLDGYLQKTVPNGEKGFTITVRSGFYSIICPGSRQTGNAGMQGSPNMPIKCTIDVDLDQKWNIDHQMGTMINSDKTGPNENTCTPYDIALIMAGNHEGGMFADTDINVKSGRIGRIVNGSLGAITAATFKYDNVSKNSPMNTFFGRANILLDPASSDRKDIAEDKRVIVTELYNGGVGRSLGSDGEINMPSMSKNTVTMKGGTIGFPDKPDVAYWTDALYGKLVNNTEIFCGIYGGGAGGANGIGYGAASDATHTKENLLPYWDEAGTAVLYGTYDQFMTGRTKKPFTVKLYNADNDYTYFDLMDTSSEINIEGGNIGTDKSPANIYGAGSGFTSTQFLRTNRPSYPNTQAGNMYGKSKDAVVATVNISGGTIYGNVYGAGRGTDFYYANYREGTTYWGQSEAKSKGYTNLGQTYGSVVTNITGGTINGNVYGAGAGVAEAKFCGNNTYGQFVWTALLAGNATVNIGGTAKIQSYTNPNKTTIQLGGNVYGGGMLAQVEGNTNVNITGKAYIQGNVYGAAQGISNTAKTTAQTISGTENTYVLNTAANSTKFGIVKGDATVTVNSAMVDKVKGVPELGIDIFGGAEYATTEGNTYINIYDGNINNVYGGGNRGLVLKKSNISILGGFIRKNVFGGGNLAEVGTAKPAGTTTADAIAEWAEANGTNIAMYKKDAYVYGDIFGGGNLANVNGNTFIGIYAGNFAGSIFGGGNGELNADGTVKTSADITGNTTINIAQDQGGQNTETKEDQFSINVIWDKIWYNDDKKFVMWDETHKNLFYDYTNKKFLNPHNIYGGGNLACKVGTWNSGTPETLVPGTGTTNVTVLKGMTPYGLLATTEWKDSYDDNANPHFYVFGGGYGKNTTVANTNVTVNVEGEYGEYTNEVNDVTNQLAKPRKVSSENTSTPVFDNSKGIPNFTVLGVLGGGYAGLVTENTSVTVDGKTFLHRVYGGGFGDPNSSVNNTTGQVGGNTEVTVQGAHTYGDVFGGGAGVVSTSVDLDNVARVLGTTSVTVADDARIYGNVFGGGDMANVGAPSDSPRGEEWYSSMPSSSSLSNAGEIQAYEAGNYTSLVNIIGGDIFGEVFGGGKGVLKTEAKDYTKVGRIEGNTLVHSRNGVDNDNVNDDLTTSPHIWNNIYGGGSYGSVDGNALVHIEGGFLGYNIYGGGFGDAGSDEPTTTTPSGTYANILGNTKVQIDGGTWMWDRLADIDGNITYWDKAKSHYAENERAVKNAVTDPETNIVDQSKIDQMDQYLFDTYQLEDYSAFYVTPDTEGKIKHPHFTINHNIYGGGNAACVVGTYASGTSVSSNTSATTGTGTATVEANHSPMTPFYDGDDLVDILDVSTVGGYSWYRSVNAVESPQFSIFGGGYGANTKVNNTVVKAQPGPRYEKDGALFNLGAGVTRRYLAQDRDDELYLAFENNIFDYYKNSGKIGANERRKWYGSIDGTDNDYRVYLRYRASQLASSLGAPSVTFMDIHGGGYSGYVVGNTSVLADHELACRNIFGGGLGSLPETITETTTITGTGTITGGQTANDISYGQVGGDAKVLVHAGNISLNVFGGGAGVESEYVNDNKVSTSGTLTDFPNVARVKGKAVVDIYGETVNRKFDGGHEGGYGVERTLVFGSVYGGGDVANVGTTAATATKLTGTESETEKYTTTVNIWGASILSQIYSGGNGRLKAECADYTQLGSVYGNTRFKVEKATTTYPYDGTRTGQGTLPPFIWNRVYGGCNKGTVYGNTYVELKSGYLAYNIFGGGFGSTSDSTVVEGVKVVDPAKMTSANVTGNTHVCLNGGEAKLSSLWIAESRTWTAANFLGSTQYSPQYDPVKQKFTVNHNIYAGGNAACKVGTYNDAGTCTAGGETYITVKKGMLQEKTEVLAGQNMEGYNFFHSNEWKEVYNKVGSPHFCYFGGGYGENTYVNNTNIDICLDSESSISGKDDVVESEEYKHFATWQAVMDIVGGGYSGKVLGNTNVNVGNTGKGIYARRVFGGGFYNSVNNSYVNIDRIDCHDIFGGGLMGDVNKSANVNIGRTSDSNKSSDSRYSSEASTINPNIHIHGNVYGANDVSGYINMSTNDQGYFQENNADGGVYIKIYGGKLYGNVFGGGNGDYLYALDREGHTEVTVNEDYLLDPNDKNSRKFPLVYTVPMRETMPSYKSTSDAAKIVNINSWRPLTNRVNIEIAGNSAADTIAILGDVYGGGNSATVQKVYQRNTETKTGDVTLNIGSNVNIGRVFMGCNGDDLFAASENNAYLADFQKLNDLTLNDTIDWDKDPSNHGIKTIYLPTENKDRPRVYPHLLDLYFYPVEMNIQGKLLWNGTAAGTNLKNCTIGTFCCGGNRGNMDIYPDATGKAFEYTFPAGLTITDAIIGGCNNANYPWYDENTQTTIYHEGGYLLGAGHSSAPYIKLIVKNKFAPKSNDTKGYLGGNVFGGCYDTGTVRGDVSVDFHSDMLTGKSKETLQKSYESATPALSVYGAGFGEDSFVYGDVNVTFGQGESITADPIIDGDGNYLEAAASGSQATSAHFVYGGGQKGNVIGLTNVDILNGHVAKAVTGGSYSGFVYGSTQVKVGYPTYYKLKAGKSGRYLLNRTDVNNLDVKNRDKDNKETTTAVKQYVCLLSGDIVSPAVYEAIHAKYNGEGAEATEIADGNKSNAVSWQTNDGTYFEKITATTPSVGWNNVRINIDEAIYGGGYSVASGSSVLANNTTVLKLTDEYNINDIYKSGNLSELTGGIKTGTSVGFAGNTTILVADATSKQGDADDRDHITVSHQEMAVASLAPGTDLFGYYYKDKDGNYHYISKEGTYFYTKDASGNLTLPDASATDKQHVYQYDSEGGIFGDGHLSYAEGFRNADLRGYGFAEKTVNNPKYINTFQRLDILRLTDNCFTVLGARDYATNATNKTPYSISRVGEIQMLADNIALNGTTLQGKSVKRSRNYMGLANNIHYVGAINSNVPFNSNEEFWRDGQGAVGTGDNAKSYQDIKQGYIDEFFGTGENQDNVTFFQKRNDGTAKNMIGIASGYALKIQNVYETIGADGKVVDNIYYGPIYGVVEMNLIDVREDEGGGYVYADNVHKRQQAQQDGAGAKGKRKESQAAHAVDFLETTGNFVFPYSPGEGHYIVDDCFPTGYTALSEAGKADPDSHVDVHYWYVTGFNYYYNAHITGYTYDSHSTPMLFNSDNSDGLTVLAGLKPGQEVAIKKWIMRSGHPNNADHEDYSCDLEVRNNREAGTSGNVDHSGNDVSGGYTLYVGAANTQTYNSDPTSDTETLRGFEATLKLDGSRTDITNATIPSILTSGDAKIAFQLKDQVDNSKTEQNSDVDYYDAHLSEPCYATLVLSAPAKEYKKNDDGTEELVDLVGKIGISYFYTRTGSGTDDSPYVYTVVADGTTLSSSTSYYFKNGVTEEYTEITSDLQSKMFTKTNDDYTSIAFNSIVTGGDKIYYCEAPRTYTYTIYLTIDYVKGPQISGNITVQNCALPGEMIRVSKENVNVESDVTFAPDGYYWRLGKRVKDSNGNWSFEDQTSWTKTSTATGYDVFKEADLHGTKGLFNGANYVKSGNCIDIPAYYFMNGYGIQLGVSMTGLDPIFPVEMTDADALLIHNYHRMDPGKSTVNLHLAEAVARAKAEPETFAEPRIYLSNTADLRAFVAFIDTVGTGAKTIAEAAAVTQPQHVKIGEDPVVVPRYGANAQFIIQNDMEIPAGYDASLYGNPIFAGTVHGEGHVITGLAPSKSLITTNNGHIYNLGMASGKIAVGNTAIDANHTAGKYHCCFEYNPEASSGGDSSPVRYVYRMDGTPVTTYTADDFRYGKVAYDLNQYYLAARQLLAGADDNKPTSLPREGQGGAALKYIQSYWHNGDYQYARRSDDKTYETTGVTYLRTGTDEDAPNYGSNLTRHDTKHTIDVSRAVDYVAAHTATAEDVTAGLATAVGDAVPESYSYYAPLFNSTCQTDGAVSSDPSLAKNDYIYWGQDLSLTPADYPATIASLQNSAMSNRVYRAVGYYGNTVPAAYHYNAYRSGNTTAPTYVHIPTATAIDFTCQADGAISSSSYLDSGNSYSSYPSGSSGSTCYYPPFNDVATGDHARFGIQPEVTRNLLVYTPANSADENLTDELYDVVTTTLGYKENAAESTIFGHHITVDGGSATTQYLHLVERTASDKNAEGGDCTNNDFCAPVAFNVTDRAWYTRVPSKYAESGNDAWEGICLPFTVNKVAASINGEITHFYGADPASGALASANDHTLHHEYWLRGLTGVDAGTGTYAGKTVGTFQRPGLFNTDAQTAAAISPYAFANSFFTTTYGSSNYNSTANGWYAEDHTYEDYLPLTSSIPYVVSFPGYRFYEFDLSSQFYNEKMKLIGSQQKSAQTVTFNAFGTNYSGTEIANNKAETITIPVTNAMQTQAGETNYYHIGTFAQVTSSSDYSMNTAGTAFEAPTGSNKATIMPFRTYMTSTASASSAKSRAGNSVTEILIGGTTAIETIEGTAPEQAQDEYGNAITIYAIGKGRIQVTSDYDTVLKVFTPSGQLYRLLDVRKGTATYSGFQPGVYVAGGKKLRVQ